MKKEKETATLSFEDISKFLEDYVTMIFKIRNMPFVEDKRDIETIFEDIFWTEKSKMIFRFLIETKRIEITLFGVVIYYFENIIDKDFFHLLDFFISIRKINISMEFSKFIAQTFYHYKITEFTIQESLRRGEYTKNLKEAINELNDFMKYLYEYYTSIVERNLKKDELGDQSYYKYIYNEIKKSLFFQR